MARKPRKPTVKQDLTTQTRGERVIAFIQRYCPIPEGKQVGKPFILEPFQKDFIKAVYDNPKGTSRAYLSIARKNGKTSLMAAILLAHIVGPEAVLNSQIVSGARSRDQAALVFDLACKMISQNPELQSRTRTVASSKIIIGLKMNVKFKALSAEAGTAHGASPVFALLDEVGQVKGPKDAFIEAIETAQGAYDAPLLMVISTQAATDGDLLSLWLDQAENDPSGRIVSHVYAAPDGCALDDWEAVKVANPGLGSIVSKQSLVDAMHRAKTMPSFVTSYRWLHLNQRISADSPFVSRDAWAACAANDEIVIPDGHPVWIGLDLSKIKDLTAKVIVANLDGKWVCKAQFYMPSAEIMQRAHEDKVPFDQWADMGWIKLCPGATVNYEFVAHDLVEDFDRYDVKGLAFDRWRINELKARLADLGMEIPDEVLKDFGQGFKSMAPALDLLEDDILNCKMLHEKNPVLTMCAANATVQVDAAGNRKLVKTNANRRIDGMVALAMARSIAGGNNLEHVDALAMIG
jgi:phage terminase large subunit-like protein